MKFGLRHLACLAILALCLLPRAQAQFGSPLFSAEKALVQPSLLAGTTAIEAGKPFTVAVRLKMEPGWHTYWQYSGDSGDPTQVEWQLPEGYKAGPIQWPIPKTDLASDEAPEGQPAGEPLLTYIYEDEVLLFVEITTPATLPAADQVLKAKVSWLACKKSCIPGDGEVSLTLPVGPAQPGNTDLFAQWQARLPKRGAPPFSIKWERASSALKLQVQGIGNVSALAFYPLPPGPEIKAGHPVVSPQSSDGSFIVTLPVTEPAEAALPWSGLIVAEKPGGARDAWQVTAPAVAGSLPQAGSAPPPQPGLLGVLGLAFLGGLILNLMPCVLPVIALKIFGFMAQADQEPRRIFQLGLAFVAGVFVFFLALAGLVIAVNAGGGRLNWGFQFQNAYLLTGLIALVFVFAMSMFGLFEISLGGTATNKIGALSQREGTGGAFLHGLFTTLLGTSCTAPFLGFVLGFAVVQPAPAVVAIFLTIAAGMSLPYFLLTWQPAWMKFLPKPGHWMERLRQFMGFVMLAVVVWLLGVVGQSRGAATLTAVCSFLLFLGTACWLLGAIRSRALAWPMAAALAAFGWVFFLQDALKAAPAASEKPHPNGGIAWEAFSPARLESAIQSGQPVFIDFTAEWCINCKTNERFVIETPPIQEAFRSKHVIALKADWTNGDPAITAMLKKLNRAGVPVYVFYLPGNPDPQVLPEILTKATMLSYLDKLQD